MTVICSIIPRSRRLLLMFLVFSFLRLAPQMAVRDSLSSLYFLMLSSLSRLAPQMAVRDSLSSLYFLMLSSLSRLAPQMAVRDSLSSLYFPMLSPSVNHRGNAYSSDADSEDQADQAVKLS